MMVDVIEHLQGKVAKYFPVHDKRWDRDFVAFFCTVNMDTVEEDFENMRKDLISEGYIPFLTHEKGEYIVYITKKPKMKYKSPIVNIILLIATIFTTTFAGTLTWAAYEGSELWSARSIIYGIIFFAFPLLLILGVHELAHYFAAKKHGVSASLPFFIPAPPILGTFGAFISMRDPIPNKKALMDIGAAGPIAGLIMTIIVTIVGFYLTDYYSMPASSDVSSLIYLGTSIMYDALSALFPTKPNVLLHPTAFAGWVGFLVTALNLLPAGQLDGGHVVAALLGKKAKYISYAAAIFLLVLGIIYQFVGWFLFLILILFIGLQHPPTLNDLVKLDNKRKAVGVLGIFVLITAFVPVPIFQVEPTYRIDISSDTNYQCVLPNESINYTLYIENWGNGGGNVDVEIEMSLDTWNISVAWPESKNGNEKKVKLKNQFYLPVMDYREINISLTPPDNASIGDMCIVNITAKFTDVNVRAHFDLFTVVGFIEIATYMNTNDTEIPAYPAYTKINITFKNYYNHTPPLNITFSFNISDGWYVWSGIQNSNMSIPFKDIYTLNTSVEVAAPPFTTNREPGYLNITVGNETWKVHKMLKLIPSPRYSLSISGPDDVSINPGNNTTLPIFIKNTGNIKMNVSIFANINNGTGISLNLTKKNVELKPEETFTVDIFIEVTEDAVPGYYTLTVHGISNEIGTDYVWKVRVVIK